MGRTVVLLGVVSLLTDISSESTAAVLPVYLTVVLGLSPLAYGVVDAVYQGGSVVARIAGGWLADRADRPKWVAVLGYGTSAVARVALLTAQGVGGVAAVLGADRIGKGLRTAPRDALIAASSEREHLAEAYGVHRAMDTAGAVLGPLISFAVLLAVPGDYRAVFVVSLAAAVLGLAVLVLLVPDLRPARAAAIERVPPARPSLRLLRDPRFGRVLAAAGLLSVLSISDGFLFLALQERNDLALEVFPLLFVGANVAYLLLAVPAGRLADRLGRARSMVMAHLLLVAAYAVAVGPVPGVAGLGACLVLLGAFYAATDGVLAALAASLVPVEIAATAIATAQSVVALGRTVASVAFGALWLGLGSAGAVGAMALLLALAVPCAWSVVRRIEVTA